MSIKLDNEQINVVQHTNGKIAVVAAPGSGKTRTLVERTKYIVKNKLADFSEILLITFTEKAKLEIIERFEHDGFKPEIDTFHSLAYKSISLYNSKLRKEKINIMNSSEESLIEKLSKFIATSYDEYLNSKINIKNEYNLYSFDDLLIKFKELLINDKKNLSNIEKIKYVMVDECQDLDTLQYEIINLINCKNLMLIGDLNQSIYGWRGAKLELFKNYYYNCDKCYNLINNYRSGKEIIDISNNLIRNNFDRVDVEVNVTSQSHSFSKKEEFASTEEQNEWIIDNIKNLTQKNIKIAIILRCDYQKESLVTSLQLNNFKYNILTNKYEELNDVISIFKALNGNKLALYQIAQRLNLEIKKVNLNIIEDDNLIYLSDEINKISNKQIDIIDKIYEVLNKLNFYYLVYKSNPESKIIISKILDIAKNKLIKQKRKYEDFGYILSTLTINSLVLNNEENNKDYTIDIMTIHSSKGLEYDYVFIPDVNDNLLPHKKGVLEEERRLFYVGITRAKTGVFISSIKKSSFLEEI